MNNRLDIHTIQNTRVGIFREPFEKVRELNGLMLRPVDETDVCWDFTHAESGDRGRMLDVTGMLHGAHVTLSSGGLAYMITRQGYTLALLMPPAPRRIRLNKVRFRKVDRDKAKIPEGWPPDIIARVINYRFRNIALIDETFLLSQIGMRK